MTSQGIASRKRTLTCKRCTYEWKVNVYQPDPDRCPSCRSPRWKTGLDGEDPLPRLEKPEAVVERLMIAAAEILTTNAKCSIGQGLDGRYVPIPPVTLKKWRETPELYGRVLCHLDRDSTSDELGQALYGSLWKRTQA